MVAEADRVVVLTSWAVALASSVVVVEVEVERAAVEVSRASSGRRLSSVPFEVDLALSGRLS